MEERSSTNCHQEAEWLLNTFPYALSPGLIDETILDRL